LDKERKSGENGGKEGGTDSTEPGGSDYEVSDGKTNVPGGNTIETNNPDYKVSEGGANIPVSQPPVTIGNPKPGYEDSKPGAF